MSAGVLEDLAAGPALSSLALTYQTVTDIPASTCGNVDPRYVIDLASHQVWAARCRRNSCAYCLSPNAWRRAVAMAYVKPERMFRISWAAPSGASDPLETARVRVKRTRQAFKRLGHDPGHWSWTLEKNPKDTGYHIHGIQRGAYIPQRLFQAATTRAKAGQPFIKRIRETPGQVSAYNLKGFRPAVYGLKGFRAPETAFEALEMNHGRLEHHTPGFFAIDGEKAKVRRVEDKAIEELFPDRNKAYIVVDRKTALYLLSDEGRRYIPRPA